VTKKAADKNRWEKICQSAESEQSGTCISVKTKSKRPDFGIGLRTNESLKNASSNNVWIDEEVLKVWKAEAKKLYGVGGSEAILGRSDRVPVDGEECLSTAYRQTEGFAGVTG